MESPYLNKPESEWLQITQKLLPQNPIYAQKDELVKIILEAWDCIFKSTICSLQIGKDFIPSYSNLGFFIENLTAIKLAERYPHLWKHGRNTATEKDIVCLKNDDYSIEIKASSSPKSIFGNRSHGQEQSDNAKKQKNGFYLAINFEKLEKDTQNTPQITLIRFGFVDHSDWRSQKSEKGQQASLSPEVYRYKFETIYEKPKKG